MKALTDFARFEANSSLLMSGDLLPSALMSKMLALLPADHQACFFLCGAFLQRLPSDVRTHLVHDRISGHVSSSFALHHVSAVSDECPNLVVCAPSASCPHSQHSPTPGPHHCQSQPPALTSRCSDSPSLYWYHRNYADQTQKCNMFLVKKLTGQQVDAFSLPACSMCSSLVYFQDKLSFH